MGKGNKIIYSTVMCSKILEPQAGEGGKIVRGRGNMKAIKTLIETLSKFLFFW